MAPSTRRPQLLDLATDVPSSHCYSVEYCRVNQNTELSLKAKMTNMIWESYTQKKLPMDFYYIITISFV